MTTANKVSRRCKHCSKEFLTSKKTKEYCNDTCRFKAWNLRNPRNKIWDPNYQELRKDIK